MSFINKIRKQVAVYWAFANTESGGIAYDNYGQPQWTDPIEVTCRWEDRIEEFLDSKGTRQLSRALVYVGQEMKPGEVLFEGELTDLDSLTVPKDNDGAWEIRRAEKMPTLRYKSATPDENQLLRTMYL